MEQGAVVELGRKGGGEKMALLSYVTAPFGQPDNDNFSGMKAKIIASVLGDLGYAVDVIDWTNTDFVPKNEYSLFIGLGGYNFEPISGQLPESAVRIYLSTGSYWLFHNDQGQARSDYLFQRRGVRINPDREITHDEESANLDADAIICPCAKTYIDTGKFQHVFQVNNAVYHDPRSERMTRDIVFTERNFLFFSGPGNLHKGLDLLLEAFPGRNEHLYVCQEIDPDFAQAYENELIGMPNIHLVGHIPFRGDRFYGFTDKCAFVIHPSCSDNQPGGVLECMHQGLIPIVSRESRIDTGDFGLTMPDCTVDGVRTSIREMSARSFEWLLNASGKARAATVESYSVEGFRRNFKSAVEKSIAIKGQK